MLLAKLEVVDLEINLREGENASLVFLVERVKTACDIEVDRRCGTRWSNMTWKIDREQLP